MPLQPPVAEELISLLEKYSNLTPVQRAILKSAAAYLVEDEQARLDLDVQPENFDPRLRMDFSEYEFVPDRIELWSGITVPKHWETPNRIAASKRHSEQLDRIMAEGFSRHDAWKELQRRKDAGIL